MFGVVSPSCSRLRRIRDAQYVVTGFLARRHEVLRQRFGLEVDRFAVSAGKLSVDELSSWLAVVKNENSPGVSG